MERLGRDGEMTEFERALAGAMRRVEVRAETTEKLLAIADEAGQERVAKGGGVRLVSFSGGRGVAMSRSGAWMRGWVAGAIAAVLVLACFMGVRMHSEHERKIEARVQAERQFETAERITDETLAKTREQLQQQGIQLEP